MQALPPRGPLDRLLSRVYVHPYGCKICRHRFYVMRWGLRHADIPVDNNQHRMRPVRIHATVLDERSHFEGDVTDLSTGGCMMELPASPLEGTVLAIHLDALDDEPPIVVEAAVVRSALKTQAVLEFLRLAKREEERLNRFVTSLWIEGTSTARSSGRWKPESSIRST